MEKRLCQGLVLLILGLVMVACQSSDETRSSAIERGQAGEQVDRICFTRQIDSWQRLDDRSIVVRRGMNEYYRLELMGACDPRDAFVAIQLESRSGICLSQGDRVRFDRDRAGLSCSIRRIHEWIPAGDDEDDDVVIGP